MVSGIVVALVGFAFESIFITDSFQLTVGTATLETGQNVLLNVEEELRQDLEPAQTLLLHTEELTVLEEILNHKNATPTHVQV